MSFCRDLRILSQRFLAYLYNFETLGSKKSLLLRILLLRQLSRKKGKSDFECLFQKEDGGESGLSLYNVHSLGNSRAIFHSGLNNKFLSPEKTHVRPFLLKWTGGKKDSFSRIVLLLHPLESDRNKPHSECLWGRKVSPLPGAPSRPTFLILSREKKAPLIASQASGVAMKEEVRTCGQYCNVRIKSTGRILYCLERHVVCPPALKGVWERIKFYIFYKLYMAFCCVNGQNAGECIRDRSSMWRSMKVSEREGRALEEKFAVDRCHRQQQAKPNGYRSRSVLRILISSVGCPRGDENKRIRSRVSCFPHCLPHSEKGKFDFCPHFPPPKGRQKRIPKQGRRISHSSIAQRT